LLNTKFVPCPKGQNVETYRIYEALECGCIPLFINDPGNEQWFRVFNNEIPFLKIESWNHAAGVLDHFIKNPEQMEQYRMTVLVAWGKYKASLKTRITAWIA